ncbi:hypothetical protein Gdia_0653 [Gluconacetobacter diazotrophicus PA1 5]|uniref:glycoside hydrolase family 66 protein n=1 Tax=Gluconacetobacter diazotrophicus TaxID=33996 RepID=UPI000173B08D|nr:glycoside hydrolase family 66 protein [Gluconacetobacter diazotrophicus]ACI50444.1 hypothetical protein Gdia_0653 [Gluconacetobacter diazotrophicus PA1 5]TWA98325.1 dextranase [Gluconacetobacter diazotrophicus]
MFRLGKLLALCAFVLAGAAHAGAPTLTGSLIQTVDSDRATYTSGDVARLFVGLANGTGGAFSGTLTATVSGRGVPVGQPVVAAVSSLAASASATVEIDIPTVGMADHQGYYVQIVAANAAGTAVDTQAAAIDYSPDWWVYPRQCWFTGTFTAGGGWNPAGIYGTPEADIAGLNAYHCNNLQFYNQLYRWHKPWTDAENWVNGDNLTQSAQLIRRGIATARRYRMGTLSYFPLYGANVGISPDFTQDGSGASLQWAMFSDNCGATSSCKLSDVWHFDANVGYMNPNNVNWQYYWAQQARQVIQHFGFDGIFVDTYGTISTPLWDWSGNRITLDTAYSSFLKTVTGLVGAPMTLNPASSYNEQDLVQSGQELYHFVERWDHGDDISGYGAFWNKSAQVWGWANRTPINIGLDWDMGLDKTVAASSSCSTNGGSTACSFSLPGILYQEATILATGAHHAWIVGGQQNAGDGARFISNDDFPIGNMLSLPAGMAQAEYDYQNFGVAYEKLLRNNVAVTGNAYPSIISGATGNATATAGAVYLLPLHRAGFDILHLLNFQQMPAAGMSDVSDPNGTYPAPTKTGALAVKMYVTSGGTLGNLYWASPDAAHGKARQLVYTTGADTSGNYITFTLPNLTYWDMVWIENGVAASDYVAP